jgi:hypothetical protein
MDNAELSIFITVLNEIKGTQSAQLIVTLVMILIIFLGKI